MEEEKRISFFFFFTEKSQICRREEQKGKGHMYTSHHVKKGVNEAGIAVDSGKDERERERESQCHGTTTRTTKRV